ncbi:MAG: hypothetical protein J3Q66DRAFT_384570 [Benniella sp.]|nr:MAG: hypothetical protein J3Q66DRAFT_384570 [Benniella sp.]
MKFFAAIATLILAAIVVAQSPVFDNCAGGVVTEINVSSFTVSPYPLCKNHNFCITATGQLAAPITEGAKVSVVGRLPGTPLPDSYYTDIDLYMHSCQAERSSFRRADDNAVEQQDIHQSMQWYQAFKGMLDPVAQAY